MNNPREYQEKPRGSFFGLLLRSHLSIAAIGGFSMLVGLAVIFFQAGNVHTLTGDSIPMARASSSVLRGVRQSLASVRGWVSLGDEGFARDWRRQWENGIEPAVGRLARIGSAMNLPGFRERMVELNLLLAELKESQWWVLEVARTPGNEPAGVKYRFEIEPVMTTLDKMLTSLHHIADHGFASPRDVDPERLYEARISFYTARWMLEKIVFQGETTLEDRYWANLRAVKTGVESIPRIPLPGYGFDGLTSFIEREFTALERASAKAIEIRKSDNWNVVRRLMETETAPLAGEVITLMDGLTRDADAMMLRQADVAHRTGVLAALGSTALLVVMIFAAVAISRSRARALSRPVTALVAAAEQLAAGELEEDLPRGSDDELGDLIRSFNTMRRDLTDTQEKMIRQEKLAAIGALSGSVAHDIRNPLGAIGNSIYYLNMISDEKTDRRIREHISIMEQEIRSANEIITDLTDFSRETAPNFSMGDLNRLLRRLLSGFDFPEGVTVDAQLDEALPLAPFDQVQMRRVFHNLIDNARQAMPEGGALGVSTRLESGFALVAIRDSGCGIARKNLDRIFEPLFTTRSRGVGLGLSIVKDFVERHGGSIEVESDVGKGATFTVRLPAPGDP